MADLTAVCLRDLARKTMIEAGGRGFMRFAEGESALLATDAVRRCSAADALINALEAAGFSCCVQEGLLLLSPSDALIRSLICWQEPAEIAWEKPLHPVRALAVRWLRTPEMAFTDAGRRLVLDTLRLTGKPGCDVPSALEPLRAHAAVMLRTQDRSGMHEAGAILRQWCDNQNRQP